MKQPNLSAGAANTHQAALFFPGDLWKGRTSHTTDTPPSYSCEIGSVDITVPAGSVHIGFLWKKRNCFEDMTRDEQFDALSKRAVVEQGVIQREGSNRQNPLAAWLPGSPAYKDRHAKS
jgi:hypothetical protein